MYNYTINDMKLRVPVSCNLSSDGKTYYWDIIDVPSHLMDLRNWVSQIIIQQSDNELL